MLRSRERQIYAEGEAVDEATRLQTKVEKGEARDYSDAEVQVAKEGLEYFVEIAKYAGSSKAREELLKDWYDVATIEDARKLWTEDRAEKQDYVKYVDQWVLQKYEPDTRRFERAIMGLPFNEALKSMEQLVAQTDEINNERCVLNEEEIVSIFFQVKADPENVQEILNSNIEKHLYPDFVMTQMNNQNASVEIRKMILDKYKNRIKLTLHPVYGERSIFRGFKDRAERERGAVDTIVSDMLSGSYAIYGS